MDLTPFEIYVNVATHYLFIQVVLRSSFIFLHTAVACSSFVNIPEGMYPFSVDAALGCFQFVASWIKLFPSFLYMSVNGHMPRSGQAGSPVLTQTFSVCHPVYIPFLIVENFSCVASLAMLGITVSCC